MSRPISSSQWASQLGWRSGGASHMLSCTTLNRSAWAFSAVSIWASGPPASSRISSAPAVSSRSTFLASTMRSALPAPAACEGLVGRAPDAAQAEHGPCAGDLDDGLSAALGCSGWWVGRRPSARLVVVPLGAVNHLRCLRTPALARSGIGGTDGQVAEPRQDRDGSTVRSTTTTTRTSSKKLQHRLLDLQVHNLRTGGRVLIGLDGWDAAGKGGLIERIVFGLEPKSVHVWRIGAPTARGAGPPLPLALLGPPAGAGQLGDLRPHLVRPRAGRADRGFLQQGCLEARLSRDQRVRAPARRRRRAHRQDPGPCQRGGAEAAHDRAAGEPA